MIYPVGEQERIPAETDTRRCTLWADTTPEVFPTTGEGITGLPDSVQLFRGTMLMVWDTHTVYGLGGDGTWRKWGDE